jgi:hypothetical protein
MIARIHVLEHDQKTSLLVKNLAQDGQPLFLRFEDSNEFLNLQGCDLLVVIKTDKIYPGDFCLCYDAVTNAYSIDRAKQIINMNDIGSDLRDVFIGEGGLCIPIANVEKIVASTFEDGDDSGVYNIDHKFVSKYIFMYNTGNPIEYVNIEFSLGGYDITYLTKEEIEEKLNPNIKRVGDVVIKRTENGLLFDVDPALSKTATINMEQLQEIVRFISEQLNGADMLTGVLPEKPKDDKYF